jgi:MiaB/RimO family radical SAM methylthiotransferase
VFLESYGCQMNSNDAEVVLSVLQTAGYTRVDEPESSDVILLNTCAIRDKAEQRVWQRLAYFRSLKYAPPAGSTRRAAGDRAVVGVLGCMAERLKSKLLEADRLADIVAGPDAYRDLPRLIEAVRSNAGSKAMNVQLSADETYADIVPVRPAGAKSAFISISRGCNNMCAFCIVPFTRGRERSRPIASILDEVRALSAQGVKEVTLLGQNVNSFADFSEQKPGGDASEEEVYAPGFRSVYAPRREGAVRFAELLERVADVDPEMRIRFTSPHPVRAAL